MGDEYRPLVAGWLDRAFELFERMVGLGRQLEGFALLVLAENRNLVVLDVDVRPPNPVSPVVARVGQNLTAACARERDDVHQSFVSQGDHRAGVQLVYSVRCHPVDVIQDSAPLGGRPELLVAAVSGWSLGQFGFGNLLLGRILGDLVPLEAVIEKGRDVIVVRPRC